MRPWSPAQGRRRPSTWISSFTRSPTNGRPKSAPKLLRSTSASKSPPHTSPWASCRQLNCVATRLSVAFEAQPAGHEEGFRVLAAGQQVGLAQAAVEEGQAGVHAGGGDADADVAFTLGAVQRDGAAQRPQPRARRGGAEVHELEGDEAVVRVQVVDHGLGVRRQRAQAHPESKKARSQCHPAIVPDAGPACAGPGLGSPYWRTASTWITRRTLSGAAMGM